MDIKEIVIEIISKQLMIKFDEIGEDLDIQEDLGADSLDVVEMLMAIEENFGLTIPDEDIFEIKTVRDLIDYIERNAV